MNTRKLLPLVLLTLLLAAVACDDDGSGRPGDDLVDTGAADTAAPADVSDAPDTAAPDAPTDGTDPDADTGSPGDTDLEVDVADVTDVLDAPDDSGDAPDDDSSDAPDDTGDAPDDGEPDGADADAGDGCVDACASVGARCDGEVLVVCAVDAQGCRVETREDCAQGALVCADDGSGELACVEPPCPAAPACAGRVAGESFCVGDAVTSCTVDALGCTIELPVDCAASSRICAETTAAVCLAPCQDAPMCVGRAPGEVVCAGTTQVTCDDRLGNGCLAAVSTVFCPGGGLCDASGGAPQCVDSCPQRLRTLTCADAGTAVLGGVDASMPSAIASYTCDAGTHPGPDAVYLFTNPQPRTVRVQLSESPSGTELDLFALDGRGQACTAPLACLAASAQPATSTEEVLFEVQPWSRIVLAVDQRGPGGDSPFALAIECLAAVCGDGAVGPGEQCDDGAALDGDGCSASCLLEAAHTCDLSAAPTVCVPQLELGTWAAGEAIPPTTLAPLAAGAARTLRISFSEGVVLEGALSAASGDVDLVLRDERGVTHGSWQGAGDPVFSGLDLRAGTYLLEVSSASGASDGALLSLATLAVAELGAFAAGDAIARQSGELQGTGARARLRVTFTEDVLLDALSLGTSGTALVLVRAPSGELLTGSVTPSATSPALEHVEVALLAGTYVLELYAASGSVGSWTLDLSTVALSVPSLGAFGSGDAIPALGGGPLPVPSFEHATVSFTEQVVLDATLGGNTSGEVGLRIYSATQRIAASLQLGTDAPSGLVLGPGTYIVQIAAFDPGLPDPVDRYALTLRPR